MKLFEEFTASGGGGEKTQPMAVVLEDVVFDVVVEDVSLVEVVETTLEEVVDVVLDDAAVVVLELEVSEEVA